MPVNTPSNRPGRRKNVIVIGTDQQRADSLGCAGHPVADTPHIDQLAARGTRYTRHYAANPVCMPSRAAFITGSHPPANGVTDNGVPLSDDQITLPRVFREAGYRTASFGKLHLHPHQAGAEDGYYESHARWHTRELDDWDGPYFGFERVGLAIIHGDAPGTGHYGNWRRAHYADYPGGLDHAHPRDKYPAFNCFRSTVPAEAWSSTWVANEAIDYLRAHQRDATDAPFYLNVSFPDPHSPFCAPEPYASMFDDVTFPSPHAVENENAHKPGPWRRAMKNAPFPAYAGPAREGALTDAIYHRILANTHAMIKLIDENVGRLMDVLRELNLADETIVVFTSDHGDLLGDHHFILKGQLPCRSLLNVPLIICDPDMPGGEVDAPTSNIDVMPTLLRACGLEVPESVQGVALPAPGEAPRRDYAFECGWSTELAEAHHYTLYTEDWRLSVYPFAEDGELYDLRDDPWEHCNRYHDPGCRATRHALTERLMHAAGQAEPRCPPAVAPW